MISHLHLQFESYSFSLSLILGSLYASSSLHTVISYLTCENKATMGYESLFTLVFP